MKVITSTYVLGTILMAIVLLESSWEMALTWLAISCFVSAAILGWGRI